MHPREKYLILSGKKPIWFKRPTQKYVEWLENEHLELIRKRTEEYLKQNINLMHGHPGL